MLHTFCAGIRDFEGKPGDRNYRNNNPGNFKFSPVGYRAIYGHVTEDKGGFAVFPTAELGWLYLTNSVVQTAREHPEWTIYDYFALKHAPKKDGNDPARYAASVAARCGVPVTTTLGELFRQSPAGSGLLLAA
jgi:hypothetical protein